MVDERARLRWVVLASAFLAAVISPTPSLAVEVGEIVTSVDAATTVGGQTVRDADLLTMKPDGGGLGVLPALGDLLPDGVDVDAVSLLDDGTVVFSTSVSFTLGGVEAHDEDLVTLQDGVLTLAFDGSASSLPIVADIDAVHVVSLAPLKFYYSLDAPAEVGGVVFADDDIIEFYRGVHTVVLTGAALLGAEAPRADVDALWVYPRGTQYAVSLDVSIGRSTGQTAADDEDIVFWAAGSLRMLFNGSEAGLDAPGLDLDAVHIVTTLFADGFESGDTSLWSSTTP